MKLIPDEEENEDKDVFFPKDVFEAKSSRLFLFVQLLRSYLLGTSPSQRKWGIGGWMAVKIVFGSNILTKKCQHYYVD